MKKVLYLMEFPIDLPGGAQMSTQTLCEGLQGTEFEPVVACPALLEKKAEELPFRIVEYHSDENREKSKFRRIWNFIRRIGSFYRIIRTEKPDLIHVTMSESLITYGFLRCLGIFKKIPFVYTDRSLYYGYRKHSMFCIRKTLKHAERMICTTQFNRNLWVNSQISWQTAVIPNTISKAFSEYSEERRQLIRRQQGISDSDFVIGFAGRISEEKDWPFVKPLVAALHASGFPFKVALVLSTYEAQDSILTEEIKQGILESIPTEQLIFMQNLSQQDMADYYYMVDVFVMTSMFESFGKAAIEAMSRRCAVLSTDVGGLTEVIGRPQNLYTKETVDRFVERVNELYHNPQALEADRDFFYNRYLNCYTEEVNIEGHCRLYRSVLEVFS